VPKLARRVLLGESSATLSYVAALGQIKLCRPYKNYNSKLCSYLPPHKTP